ncbi:MAG: DoxX family protein [Nanoarchaeota archaeon]|nr:DoxX family protein [Nanoarchaeota archaeon]
MIQFLFPFADWGFVILRVALGLLLLRHGAPKLKDVKGTGQWMASVGFKPGVFWAALVGALEVFGGLALVLGFFTQIISGLFAIQFIVILLTLKRKAGLKDKEYDVLILAVLLFFVVAGGGGLSLDEYFTIIFY